MKQILLLYILISTLVTVEVVGACKLYPLVKDSLLKLFIFYFGVYIIFESYRRIKNYCDEVLY